MANPAWKSAVLPEIVFYCYNIFDQTPCEKFTYEMPVPKSEYIRNPENNQLVVDPFGRRTVEFIQWAYRTNDPKEIAELSNYNEKQRKSNIAAAVLISTEVLYPTGTKVQKVGNVETVEVKYIPSSALSRLDLQSIIELAMDEFGYTITSPTKEEAIEELANAGHAK